MKLTPEIIAEHYDILRLANPFKRLKLPARRTMQFRVTKNKRYRGYFRGLKSGYVIAISEEHNATGLDVQRTMAHEMIHAHLEMICPDAPHHGKEFQKLADKVCECFGYDRRTF